MPTFKPRLVPASEYNVRGRLSRNSSLDADAMLNRVMLQAAYDQIQPQSSTGPGATIEGDRGPFWIDRPVQACSNSRLLGWHGKAGMQLIPTYIGGPALAIAAPDNASPHGAALLTGEDFSIDIETAAEGSGPDYVKRVFDYGRQLGIHPRNWTSMRLEFKYKLKSSPIDTATIWNLGGQRTTAEGYTQALWVGFISGQLICDLRVSTPGADPRLVSATRVAVPTPSVVGTAYYVCLDWDGTTIKLWHATSGTVMAAPVASAAASGVFHAKYYECLTLGSAGYGFFPDPLPEQLSAAPALVSGHVFSSVSKHQAGFTAPSAAFTPAADDWLTFVAVDANEIALSTNYPTSKNCYRVDMLGGRTGYHILVRSTYNVIENIYVEDLTINGAGQLGGGITGIFASGAIKSKYTRVNTLYCGVGFDLRNNGYLSEFDDCDAIGGNFTWSGMPTNGQRCARLGLSIGGASGICVVSKIKIASFGYGLASGYGSFEGQSIWITENFECKALFNQPTTMTMRGLTLADEGEAGFAAGLNENDYSLIVQVSGTGQALKFQSSVIEVSNTLRAVTPVGLSGEEYRSQVSFDGLKITLAPYGYPIQPEIFHCLNDTFRPVQVHDMVTYPAYGNLTRSNGKVLRDGVAMPYVLGTTDETVYWHDGKHAQIPTLPGNVKYYLDDTINTTDDSHPYDGAVKAFARLDATDAHTAEIYSGTGASATLIYTFPVSQLGFAGFMYRVRAAEMSGTPTLTFDAAAHTVSRGSGNWVTEGFQVGDLVTCYTGSLNRWTGRVTALTTTLMTLAAVAVVDEVTASVNYVYASRWIVAP